MIAARWHLSRFYLAARNRGWDYSGSLRYAIDRNNNALLKRFA